MGRVVRREGSIHVAEEFVSCLLHQKILLYYLQQVSAEVLRLSSNLIVEVRRTVSYRGLVLHLHVSSEVYCGDVCGEQHQVAVEGFVRVHTEEQPLDPCCMRHPTGVVEWAYLPLGEIVRSRDPGVHIL